MSEELAVPQEPATPVENQEPVTPIPTQEPTPEPENKPEPETVQQYTPEELTKTIQDNENVDTSRLSQEGVALMKAMQRGFTPKLEEAATIRKELKELRESFEAAKPKAAPTTIEEAYEQDPNAVMSHLDGEIATMLQADPVANAYEVEQLRNVKHSLAMTEVNNLRTRAQQTETLGRINADLRTAVPDLAQKKDALGKFAIDILNYTPQELQLATDPVRSGADAVRNVARINAAYEKFNAGKTVTTKQVQKQATPVEQPGSGVVPSTPDVRQEMKAKAISGEVSWHDYLITLGA